MKPVFCILNFLLLTAFGYAGDAVFSADGNSVTYISPREDSLLKRIAIETGEIETLPLKLPKEQSVISVGLGVEGELLFLTEKAVWVYEAKGPRKLCNVGDAQGVEDLAVAPSSHGTLANWMFVSGSEKGEDHRTIFFGKSPGTKAFSSVFCRRVNNVRAGVFTADGRFFFAERGDLWEGSIDPGDAEGTSPTLEGVRIAPLAFLNTDGSNSGSMYIGSIVPAGTGIYVVLRGHHMGQLLRVPLNPTPALSEGSGANEALKDHYAYLAESLAAVEIIDDSGEPIRSCAAASIDGKERVFYGKGQSLYLWEKSTGKTREVATEEE